MIIGIIFYLLCIIGMWVHLGALQELIYKYEQMESPAWVMIGASIFWPLALVTAGIGYLISFITNR